MHGICFLSIISPSIYTELQCGTWYNSENRTPYAAIQTSLGCQFGCNFCMINILNRNDNDEIGVAETIV